MESFLRFTLICLFLTIFSCDISETVENNPEISDFSITSYSFDSYSETVYEGDDIYICVTIADQDDDPESLDVVITDSAGSSVYTDSISSSLIFDETLWKFTISGDELSLGSYTIELQAFDSKENGSNTISKSFSVVDNPKDDVTAGDISVVVDSWGALGGSSTTLEIHYHIDHIAPVSIDIITTQFEAYDIVPNSLGTGEGSLNDVETGDAGVANIYVSSIASVDDVQATSFSFEFY